MRKIFLALVIMIGIGQIVIAQGDSLRLEREGEKAFVIHKVLAKQTLFSLAQRYETTVDAIRAENPTVASGLQVGQTLKIPYGGSIPVEEAPEESEVVTETITHKVKAGETLFAIAQMYDVNINELKEWNNLQSNAISLNQELIIRKMKAAEEAIVSDTETALDSTPVEEVQEQKEDSISYPGTPFQQVVVEGVAEVIEEEEPSSKFFALHRTAKEGTVIKVRNLMNDLTVYVRVVGTIPETSNNEGVLIKLNQRAYENLKAIDKRFRVELSYFQ